MIILMHISFFCYRVCSSQMGEFSRYFLWVPVHANLWVPSRFYGLKMGEGKCGGRKNSATSFSSFHKEPWCFFQSNGFCARISVVLSVLCFYLAAWWKMGCHFAWRKELCNAPVSRISTGPSATRVPKATLDFRSATVSYTRKTSC